MQLKKNNCAIMQPTFMSWVGYFDLINSVDKFVFLDDVQLAKRSWQVRNKIKTSNGEYFVTLPIEKTKHRDELTIDNAVIKGSDWKDKFLKTIQHNYKKASHYAEIYPFIEELINYETNILSEFNINIIVKICKKINIKTEFFKSSDLTNIGGTKDEKLVNICFSIDMGEYLSPQGSAVYIELDSKGGEFTKNNIELYYHNYEPTTYKQLYGAFIPYIGIFDLLFNEGFQKSLDIIKSGHRDSIHYRDFNKD
jgi:hypothetical protein